MFKTVALVYFVVVVLMSVVTFLVYGWDKRQAKKAGWRIPESRLHGLALLGGWPGALLGQRIFRHKTRKLGFQLTTWFIVAVHLIAIAAFVWRSGTLS
jgi:uncharacterized membrane protein YsdA (DUF1294 family)